MKSFIQEMINSLSRNKLRSFLTAFSIAWGIMLLIILLGLGRGVQNGLWESQKVYMTGSSNAIEVFLGATDRPYAGMQKGRLLYLTRKQQAYLKEMNPEIEHIEPKFMVIKTVESDLSSTSGNINPLSVRQLHDNEIRILKGRNFTKKEIKQGAQLIIMSDKDAHKLFLNKTEPIGSYVTIDATNYKVIGIMESKSVFIPTFYIPYKTFMKHSYANEDECNYLDIFTKPEVNQKAFQHPLKKQLTHLLRVDPNDQSGVVITTPSFMQDEMNKIFRAIDILLYIIGISTLSIGIIGVSNIMQVTVRERIKEIGIRKAIGARPRDIIVMVLGESIFISVLSGIIGILIGIGSLKGFSYLAMINKWGQQSLGPKGIGGINLNMFANPSVDMGITITALIILIISGLIAGYGPARKATKIPAVVAMRDMK